MGLCPLVLLWDSVSGTLNMEWALSASRFKLRAQILYLSYHHILSQNHNEHPFKWGKIASKRANSFFCKLCFTYLKFTSINRSAGRHLYSPCIELPIEMHRFRRFPPTLAHEVIYILNLLGHSVTNSWTDNEEKEIFKHKKSAQLSNVITRFGFEVTRWNFSREFTCSRSKWTPTCKKPSRCIEQCDIIHFGLRINTYEINKKYLWGIQFFFSVITVFWQTLQGLRFILAAFSNRGAKRKTRFNPKSCQNLGRHVITDFCYLELIHGLKESLDKVSCFYTPCHLESRTAGLCSHGYDCPALLQHSRYWRLGCSWFIPCRLISRQSERTCKNKYVFCRLCVFLALGQGGSGISMPDRGLGGWFGRQAA